jgi:hypothetical protein
MAQGQHSSIRVALAIPPKLHEQIKAWAEYEGRPVASLCLYLIENSLRQAQKDGLAPSFKTEEEGGAVGIDKWEPEFRGDRYESAAEKHERKRASNDSEGRKQLIEALIKKLVD